MEKYPVLANEDIGVYLMRFYYYLHDECGFSSQKGNKMEHTMFEDFEHFLTYSGLWNEQPRTIKMLLRAFDAAWEPSRGGNRRIALDKDGIDAAVKDMLQRNPRWGQLSEIPPERPA